MLFYKLSVPARSSGEVLMDSSMLQELSPLFTGNVMFLLYNKRTLKCPENKKVGNFSFVSLSSLSGHKILNFNSKTNAGIVVR